MEKLMRSLFQFKEYHFRVDDDFVDRINRQYTPTVMMLFTVLVTMKQYVGDPISCWCPAQFTSSHVDYTNTLCWVSDTYYVPFDEEMPNPGEPRYRISYYQWVPLFLIGQGWLFFMPYVMWRFLNRRVGINLAAIIEAAQASQKAIYPETRDKTVRYIVHQIDSYLGRRRKKTTGCCARIKHVIAQFCCIVCSKFYGNYLVGAYITIKLFYVINVFSQLFLLDAFLGMESNYHLYGMFVIGRLITGNDWSYSVRFPRVTLCDFQVRQQKNVQTYTVQCVLPINLFNEKIFIFIWFWLFFVALFSVASLIQWVSAASVLPVRVGYVRRQLRAIGRGKMDAKAIRKFTENYLKRDGFLIVRLVGVNAGTLVAADVLYALWCSQMVERSLVCEGHPEPSTQPLTTAALNAREGHADDDRWSFVRKYLVKNTEPDGGNRFSCPEEV